MSFSFTGVWSMVVVDQSDILITTFKWIYPSVFQTRIIENTEKRKKKKLWWIYHRLPLFHFFLEKCFMIWHDLIWFKSGLKIRFSNHIIFHKNFILLKLIFFLLVSLQIYLLGYLSERWALMIAFFLCQFSCVMYFFSHVCTLSM